MASLLSFAKGVERQLNPFDNGATYANPHPVPQPPVAARPQLGPPMTNNSPIQLGGVRVQPPNLPTAQPAPHANPVFHFLGTAAGDIGHIAAGTGKALGQIASIPYNAGKTIPANLTHNQTALQHANTAMNRDINTATQFAQFLPRAVVQLRNSAAEGLGGNAGKRQLGNFVPNKGLERILLGNQPIQSLQQNYKDVRKQSGTQQAAINTALTTATDLLAAKGGVDTAIKGGKAAISASQNRVPLLSAEEGGRNVPKGGKLTPQEAKQLGQKLTTPPQPPKIVTPPLGKKPLGVVKTVATSPQTTAPLSRKIQGSYDPISNKSAVAAASQRIAQDPGAARSFAETTHSAEGNATAIQLAKQLEAEGKHDQAASLMVTKAQQALQAGQGNQIYSMWNKLSPETVAQTAAKTIERYNQTARSPIPQLTGEQYQAFVNQAKAIQGMAEGSREKGMATQSLLKDIAKLVPSKGGDKAFSLYRTGLLTGFRTPGKVLVSHGVSSVAEQVKNLPAKAADAAIGLARAPFTGSYQRGLSVTGRGNLHGFNVGTRGAIDNLVHGYRDPLTGGHQPDFTNDVHFGNSVAGKAANAYVQGVTRLHSSIYQPFFGAQHFNSLYDMAITNAKNQGLKGAERDSYVQGFVKKAVDSSAKDQTSNIRADFSTPEGAAQRARAEAEYTTFQNKTLLSNIASGAKKGSGNPTRYVVPFSQIPSSIASKIVDYSPIGPVKEAIIQAKNRTFDQRALSQAIGRGATGTSIAALGYHLFNNGHITTEYPTDKKTQAQWKLEGKQANSILVGGKWRQLASLGPAGDAIGVGANVAAGMKGNKKTPGSLTNAAVQGGIGGINVLSNSPYLQGLQNIGAAIKSPGTSSQKVAEGLAGGTIPTGIANIASAADPLQRQTNSVKDSITNKIPGLREKNLPQVDVLGNNVPRAQGALGNLLDPFYSTTAKTDPLTSEFNRLNNTYNPATPTPITKDQSINGQKVNLNPSQLTQLQQKSGQVLNQGLNQLTQLPSYQAASDQTKANTIGTVTTAIRDAVKNGQPVDFGTILGTAQNNLDKQAFLQSGQQTATINGKNYHLTATGKASTATPKKVSVKTSSKTTTAKKASTKTTSAKATTTKSATFSPSKAVAAFNKGTKGIKTASAFKVPKPPKGVKVRVAKASSSSPKLKRIAVNKIPSNYLNKRLV